MSPDTGDYLIEYRNSDGEDVWTPSSINYFTVEEFYTKKNGADWDTWRDANPAPQHSLSWCEDRLAGAIRWCKYDGGEFRELRSRCVKTGDIMEIVKIGRYRGVATGE